MIVKNGILNFEVASYKVIQKFFVGSNFHGCNFHLGQIVWRGVQHLKFSKKFLQNKKIRFNVKMILALSFVPKNKVLVVSTRLKKYFTNEKSWEVLRLLECFQTEYLKFDNSNKSIDFGMCLIEQ